MLLKLLNESLFFKKIDYIILFLIAILLISLTFASTSVIGILIGLCFVMLVTKLLFKEGKKLTFSVFDKPIFLYVFIVGLSVAFSPLVIPSLKGYLKLLTYFCVYLTFFNVIEGSKKRTYLMLGIIALTAFIESMIAIHQNFFGVEALATWQDHSGVNPEQMMTRVYGTLQPFNPNLLAGYLIASISSAAGLFFIFAYKKQFRPAVIALVAFLAIMAAIVFTGSRGAYIALFAILSGIMLTSGHIIWHDFSEKILLKKLWLFIMFAGGAAALFLILSSPALQHRITSIFTVSEDSSNAFRLNVYTASLKMFWDSWIIGIGPGNETFRLIYGLYMRTGFDALGTYCVPLEIAVESGIFALLAFSWLIIKIFLSGVKTILSKCDVEQKIIILICVIGIVGIMTHGLVDTIFFRPQVQVLFWMLVAMVGTNFSRVNF